MIRVIEEVLGQRSPAAVICSRQRFGAIRHVSREAILHDEKASLIVDEKTYAQQLDLLRFQSNEITAAKLRPEEDHQMEQDYHRANHAARLLELAQSALRLLSEEDQSLLTQAGALGRALQEMQGIDPGASLLTDAHEQTVSALRELQTDLSRYTDHLDIDPQRLQELEDRLNLIQSLRRKYGSTLADIIAFGGEAQRKLQSLEQRDVEVARLNSELQKLEEEIVCCGKALSSERRKVIPLLRKAVIRQLRDLGFQRSHFDAAISTELEPAGFKTQIPFSGFDVLEFVFAPNPGEPAHPLRAIASSGEMARVMLALKTVLATEDEIPVLVFDEVDANVGGETANVVGEKMLQIAQNRQVLCITHLPQVAAHASAHYVVTKQLRAGRTVSEITLLDKKDRITELARMLGGQSDAARKHAEVLLGQGKQKQAGLLG